MFCATGVSYGVVHTEIFIQKGNDIILCWTMVSFRGQINPEPRLCGSPSGVLIPISDQHPRHF